MGVSPFWALRAPNERARSSDLSAGERPGVAISGEWVEVLTDGQQPSRPTQDLIMDHLSVSALTHGAPSDGEAARYSI